MISVSDQFHHQLEERLLVDRKFDPDRNILAFGFGRKVRNGQPTGEDALRIYVREKIKPWDLPFDDPRRPIRPTVPMRDDLHLEHVFNIEARELNPHPRPGEIATDIIAAPASFHLLAYRNSQLGNLMGGISIGLENETTGTLGCLVRNRTGATSRPAREFYLLSAGHVLDKFGAAPTTTVCQPGALDCSTYGLTPASQRVADVVLIDAPTYSTTAPRRFLVDAGIARPHKGVDALQLRIMECGAINEQAKPVEQMIVKKVGRTTGLTIGRITDTRFSLTLGDPSNSRATAILSDQVATTAMGREGDSGSIVLDEQNRVVGLLCAGTDDASVFTSIDAVFSALDVDLF